MKLKAAKFDLMENSFTDNKGNIKAKFPLGSILYLARLVIVILATPLIVLEPHIFQGYGYSAVDYTLLLIPFCLAVILIVHIFRRTKYFPYFVHILCGYNLTLFILTLTPFFLEENKILIFLLAADLAMTVYLRRSKRAEAYYGSPWKYAKKGEAEL